MLSWSLVGSTGEERRRDKVGELEREKHCTSQNQKSNFQEPRRGGSCVQTSHCRGASASGPFLIKGVLPRRRLSGGC